MARMRGSTAIAGIAMLAALWTGCGGEDVESKATAQLPAHPTELQYAKRMKAICARAHGQIGDEIAALDAGGAIGEPEARKALTGVILPRVRTQYEEMRRLPPPRGDEDFLDRMLWTLASSLETGEESLKRFFRIKPSSYTEFGEATVMSGEYGARGCGSFGHSAREVVADYLAPIPGPNAPLW